MGVGVTPWVLRDELTPLDQKGFLEYIYAAILQPPSIQVNVHVTNITLKFARAELTIGLVPTIKTSGNFVKIVTLNLECL